MSAGRKDSTDIRQGLFIAQQRNPTRLYYSGHSSRRNCRLVRGGSLLQQRQPCSLRLFIRTNLSMMIIATFLVVVILLGCSTSILLADAAFLGGCVPISYNEVTTDVWNMYLPTTPQISSRQGHKIHQERHPVHIEHTKSKVILYAKSPTKDSDSSNKNNKGRSSPPPAKRETKSVVQSFFANKNQEEQKASLNKQSTANDETSSSSSSFPQSMASRVKSVFRRSKNETDTIEQEKPPKKNRWQFRNNEKEQIEKPVLSDKLRRRAMSDQPNQAEPIVSKPQRRPQIPLQQQKNAKNKVSKEDNEVSSSQQGLWNRVTGWMPGRGEGENDNDNRTDKDSAELRSNSTNPLSAFQQYWQDSRWKRDEEWVDVIPKTRLSPGEVVPVTVGGLDLLIIAGSTSDNRIYAIANSCPHLGTPLEIGQLVRLPKETPPSATNNGESSSVSSTGAGSTSSETGYTSNAADRWTELQVSSILKQDGCEDCIVCPLHKTAFALESGQVRGEWCPYPPIVGKLTGLVKEPTPVATFDVRVRKKNIQIRLNSLLALDGSPEKT